MTTETKLQYDIIKSVKTDGGYARKQSSRFQVGVVDLLISYPTFCPVIAEVKDLGKVPEKFSRQLAVTPKQALDMERFDMAQQHYTDGLSVSEPLGRGTLAFILVGFVHLGEHLLAYLPRTTKRLSSDDVFTAPTSGFIARERGPYYNMKLAMEGMNVPRLI